MAIVRVSGVLLGVGMLMLSGCVISHGPDVANALDVNLEVIVRHADGDIRNIPFKPGFSMAVGKGDWDVFLGKSNNPWKDGDPWEAIPIEEVVIKEAGRVLHQFNTEEVRLLIEKQEREGGLWCIERETVYLVQAYKYNKNPDARERCSKGKPFVT